MDEYYFESTDFSTMMAHYGIFWFVAEYALPTAFFIVLYARVVWVLRRQTRKLSDAKHVIKAGGRRNAIGGIQTKCNVSVAEEQLTRTAIVVTIFFIIALGVESWRYFLGRVGVICYRKDTFQLVLGVFLTTLNSSANPLIYSVSLPVFRKHLKDMFNMNVRSLKTCFYQVMVLCGRVRVTESVRKATSDHSKVVRFDSSASTCPISTHTVSGGFTSPRWKVDNMGQDNLGQLTSPRHSTSNNLGQLISQGNHTIDKPGHSLSSGPLEISTPSAKDGSDC